MNILLTEDVAGVGDIGETVSVKPGFARNYLIPNGVAVEANSRNSRGIAHMLKQLEKKKQNLKIKAEEEAQKWEKINLKAKLKVAGKGKVFGSITSRDLSDLLQSQKNITVDRRRILLADPLRKLGEHTVSVKLHADVTANFKVTIEKEEATEEDVKKVVDRIITDMDSYLTSDEDM